MKKLAFLVASSMLLTACGSTTASVNGAETEPAEPVQIEPVQAVEQTTGEWTLDVDYTVYYDSYEELAEGVRENFEVPYIYPLSEAAQGWNYQMGWKTYSNYQVVFNDEEGRNIWLCISEHRFLNEMEDYLKQTGQEITDGASMNTLEMTDRYILQSWDNGDEPNMLIGMTGDRNCLFWLTVNKDQQAVDRETLLEIYEAMEL